MREMTHELTESDIFVLLADRRRRVLLRILQETSTPLTIGEVSDRIGDREYENPTVNERRTVYLSLYHHHLPRLDEAAVIAYDGAEGTVAPGLNFDSLVRVLEEVTERELPWSDV